MAHELSFKDGQAEVILREHAWHGLGTIKADGAPVSYADAMSVVDYTVEGRPLTTSVPLLDARGEEYDALDAEVPGYRAAVRIDTGKVLGVVGSKYHFVQNREVMRPAEVLVDQGLATIEAAGVLRQGADAWMSLKFQGAAFDAISARTPTLVGWYGLLRANHTTRAQVQLGLVGNVVVCANTLSMALNGKSLVSTVRHTSGAAARVVAEAQRLWGVALQDAGLLGNALVLLQQTVITEQQFERAVLDVLAALPTLGEDKSDRAKARHANACAKVEETRMVVRKLWFKGTGVSGAPTAYDALMAATESMDHFGVMSPNRGASRAENGIARLPGGRIDAAKGKVTSNLMALAGK